MTTIEINGPITKKAWMRLKRNVPLTIEIKGVGKFKAYIQTLEQNTEVTMQRSISGGVVGSSNGPSVVKLGLSNLYRRRLA